MWLAFRNVFYISSSSRKDLSVLMVLALEVGELRGSASSLYQEAAISFFCKGPDSKYKLCLCRL